MKAKFFILPLLVSFAFFINTGFVPEPPQQEEVAEINWITMEEAAELAKQDGKKILIDFYTDWCGWCKRMDATTYKNPEIIQYISENFHAVKFDAEQKEAVTINGKTYKYVPNGRRGYHELAAQIMQGKLSYPTTTFMQSNFTLLYNVPGYLKVPDLSNILSFTNEEAFKNTSYQQYVSDKKRAGR